MSAVLLLLVLPFSGAIPAAEAAGAGACTIIGTAEFAPSAATPSQGTWTVRPATIQCHGLIRGRDRYDGSGFFRGSGAYTAMAGAGGACLYQSGTGTVEYQISTTLGSYVVREDYSFVLAGGGLFKTPSLEGSFQVRPPYDGNCITEPLTRAGFHAQAVTANASLPVGAGGG